MYSAGYKVVTQDPNTIAELQNNPNLVMCIDNNQNIWLYNNANAAGSKWVIDNSKEYTVSNFIGNVIPLSTVGIAYNTDTAVSFASFTASATLVVGATAKIFYNGATEPTFPAGWINTGGVAFAASTDLDLFIEVEHTSGGSRVIYFYVTR